MADFIPGVGSAKSLYAAIAGYDPITGEAVDRKMELAGIALGLIPGGKLLTKGKKIFKFGEEVLEHTDDLAKAAARADELAEAARATGGRFATEAQVIAGIERNADLAVELTRRQAARGLVRNSDQAFGSRSHLLFDKLNKRLGREMRLDGSDFRLESEVFRDSSLLTGARNAPGSIGADVFLTRRGDPFYSRVFDLKTYGTTQIPISSARQSLFQARFGAQAKELYRVR